MHLVHLLQIQDLVAQAAALAALAALVVPVAVARKNSKHQSQLYCLRLMGFFEVF